MSCPHRHESARFVDDRPKTAQSLVGTFPLDRADYHRRARGRGTVPRDETLGLSRPTSTPGAREPVSIAGAVDGFGEAANVVLREMSVLRPSGSTVERTSEAVGGDIGRRLADGETFAASTPWPWPEDAEGKTCAYASLDPTGPGMQGPDGASAGGRMAATAMVYNPVPEDLARRSGPAGRRPVRARYVSGSEGQAALGEPLREQAARVGMDRAERWIASSDAGAGVEEGLRMNFGRVDAVIPDFYHVAEHLGDLGRALHPGDEAAREDRIGTRSHRLEHEGGEVVLMEPRGLPLDGREAVRKVHGAVLGYFEDHGHRVGYPTYRAKGRAIGSGPVESGVQDGHRRADEERRDALGWGWGR